MDNLKLTKRIDGLSEKINADENAPIIHLDFNSFSDAEKTLFQKVKDIEYEFQKTRNVDVLLKNAEFMLKPSEILVKRTTELYCHVLPTILGYFQNRELVEYFFKLHFYNFETDLAECLQNLQTWTDKDKEQFLLDLKKNGTHLFRIPRGFDKDYCRALGELINSKESEEKNDQTRESDMNSKKTKETTETNLPLKNNEGG